VLKDYHKEINCSTLNYSSVERELGVVFLPDVVVNLIVIALGIKRRVDITKVSRFITEEAAENVEIIAVVEFVHLRYLLTIKISSDNDKREF